MNKLVSALKYFFIIYLGLYIGLLIGFFIDSQITDATLGFFTIAIISPIFPLIISIIVFIIIDKIIAKRIHKNFTNNELFLFSILSQGPIALIMAFISNVLGYKYNGWLLLPTLSIASVIILYIFYWLLTILKVMYVKRIITSIIVILMVTLISLIIYILPASAQDICKRVLEDDTREAIINRLIGNNYRENIADGAGDNYWYNNQRDEVFLASPGIFCSVKIKDDKAEKIQIFYDAI